MLRTIHRFRLVFLVVLVLSSVALAFSGYTYQLFDPGQSPAAVRLDDRELTFRDIQNERQEIEQMYMAQFGANFHRAMQMMGINVQNQALDRAIQASLMTSKAENLGFASSKQMVADQLSEAFWNLPNAREQYEQFLRTIEMGPREYESRMLHALTRGQLEQAVRDSSLASVRETKASLALEKTSYDVTYVALNAKDFSAEIPAPSEESVRAYYDDNASDFELPARVTYSFVSLDPEKFLDLVEVFPDDVEIYYTDHVNNYLAPEKRTVRLIELRTATPKSAKGKSVPPAGAESQLEKKIEEVTAKLKAGESFSAVAKAYSTHQSAQGKDPSVAGVLGTVSKEELSSLIGEPAASAAFSLEAGKASDAIKEDGVARIVLVDSITPATPKELSEVRSEIEQVIRLREAPAFLAVHASELFEAWEKAGNNLSAFIAEERLSSRSLTLQDSSSLAATGNDPVGFSGLTERVLENVDQPRQLIDLGNRSVLVQIKEAKEPEVPALDVVRGTIIERIREREAASKARSLAQTIVDELSQGKFASLALAAKASGQKLHEVKSIKRDQPAAPFAQGEIRDALFGVNAPEKSPRQVYSVDGTHYVFEVTAITRPSATELEKELAEARERESNEAGSLVLASLINTLKSETKIDIQPGALAQQ